MKCEWVNTRGASKGSHCGVYSTKTLNGICYCRGHLKILRRKEGGEVVRKRKQYDANGIEKRLEVLETKMRALEQLKGVDEKNDVLSVEVVGDDDVDSDSESDGGIVEFDLDALIASTRNPTYESLFTPSFN